MSEQKLSDNEIIKALERMSEEDPEGFSADILDLINRLKAENDDLFYKLTGVMCSVDKWLEGDELKQDEVNRAATMREKTLQIVEKLEVVLLKKEDTMQLLNEEHQYTVDELQRAKAEIERLQKDKADIIDAVEYRINQAKEFAYKEFAERLKATDLSGTVGEKYVNGEMYGYFHNGAFERIVDNLLAELTTNFNKLPHNSLCETETYEGEERTISSRKGYTT